MVIQNLYETGSAGIISVGYTDVASGKSRTNIYAGVLSGAGVAQKGVLSNVPFYSEATDISITNTETAFDLDFDLTQTIAGQTIIQIPVLITGGGSGGDGWIPDLELQKVYADNTTLSITSGATRTLHAGVSVASGAVFSTFFDLSPITFKSGEKLRLRMKPTVSGGGTIFKIGCDPMDRGTLDPKNSSVPTKLTIQVPFKVDL